MKYLLIFLVVILIYLNFNGVLCSHYDCDSKLPGNSHSCDEIKNVRSNNMFDRFISIAMDEASTVSNRTKSILEESYAGLKKQQSKAAFSSDSSLNNYKMKNFKMIFEFMKRNSDEIIILPATEKIIKLFIRKVSISVNEINFVKNLENFIFPDSCAEHMLQAIKKLDPSLEINDSLNSVLTLAEYCSSDSCQDLIFSLILKYLEKPNNQLPFFNINSQIKETSIIDTFFETCYDLIIHSNQNNQIIPITLIRIIIDGPYSFKSTQILMNLFNESKEIFKCISESRINARRLAIRLKKSGYFEYFLEMYPATQSSISDENIFELKSALESEKHDLDIIFYISNPEHNVIQEVDAAEIMEYVEELEYDYKILEFYWNIDPEFVKSVTMDLNAKIIRIINEFKNLKSINDKIVHLFSAYIYINLIPKDKSYYIPLTQYDELLDYTIEMMNNGIKFNISFHLIRTVISFPFVKITESVLEKFWNIYTLKFGKNISIWNISSISLILIKLKDPQEAWELFKMIFNFFESKQLEFNVIAALLVVRFTNPYFRDVFNFCKQHKILHKLQIETIEKSFNRLDLDKMA